MQDVAFLGAVTGENDGTIYLRHFRAFACGFRLSKT